LPPVRTDYLSPVPQRSFYRKGPWRTAKTEQTSVFDFWLGSGLEAGRSSDARSSTHHVIPFVGCPTNELVWSARQQDRTQLSGKPATFLLAALIVVVWAVTGRVFHYSDTWQLVINTGTTIITFLMVFLIQHTQNRDTAALQPKLDELIFASKAARNSVVCIEDATGGELNSAKDDMRERIVQKPSGRRRG
jgi:low affinity Fe/Cu permease